MFYQATAFNQDIGNWNTTAVTDMSWMFYGCTNFNQDIGGWNTVVVTTMISMFRNCTNFNQNIGNWNTASVTNMSSMFASATSFNQYIGNWNTENVISMSSMFFGAVAFNQDISSWNTQNVIDMVGMFFGAVDFNQDISSWNTQNVTNMRNMFEGATSFNQNIGNWNTQNVINMYLMFSGATSFNQNIGNWNISSIIHNPNPFPYPRSMQNMLNNCGMNTTNYDATLIGWAAQTVNTGVQLGAQGLEYCVGEAARNTLIANGWTITGDNKVCPTPEIAIFGNNTEITNGDTSPSVSDHTDYNNDVTFSCNATVSVIRYFTIRNTGNADLHITNITSSGVPFFVGSINVMIAPNGFETFIVLFQSSPTGVQSYTGNITVTSNDIDEASYVFSVKANGAGDFTPPSSPILTAINSQCSVPSLTAPTTTDNCSGTITGTTTQTFPITSSTTVTWTFTDAAGNFVTAIQNVVINDNTNPAVPTLAAINSQCSVPSLTAPTTTDNCSGTITGTTTQTFPITSSTTVTWTFTDAAGNFVTAIQNVVINDNTNPAVPTLAAINSQCSVPSLTAPTTTDNCSGTITGTTTQTFPITSSTTVTWTFTDAAGNFVTAIQNVVINDNTNPAVPTLAAINSQCSVPSLTAPTTTDNCVGTVTGTTTTTFPITSSTTVTWTFNDGNGNSVTANQNVVIADTQNPAVPTLATINSQCSVASLVAPTTTDNCSGTITGTTSQTFPITSSTTVVWKFTDASGNSVTANQNVVITDTQNPAVPTLATINSQCFVASLVAPTTTDNCSGTVTGTTTQTFPITSSTTVVWTFTDASGNSVTANQNVVIADTQNPVVPTLANVTAQCSVTSLTAPTTTDNCSGTVTGTTTQTFPITSSTTVVWTFTDASGNSVTANQNVVIADTQNPVVPTLTNVTAQCSVASLVAPTTTDNCSGTVTGTTSQTFPITAQGTTVVTWTFDDGNGNSVTANQNVIIDDTTNPVVPTIADFTAQCSVPSIPAPTTTDNCSGTITGTTTQTFPITSQGTTVVTWTFTDAAGNFVTATQNIVINDNTNPAVPTIADFTAQCSVASLTAPTTTDNCSGTITGTTTQTFPITSQGTTVVTWTFTDAAGNFVTATQNIVINDNTNPAVPTIADFTAQCSVASLTAPTTTDNCSGTITGTTTQTFPITSSTTVTWRFTDAAGNFVTATQNVVINDNTNPVIPTLADVTAQCSVASLTAPTTTDNCSGTITGITTQTFPITTQGTTIVTWRFIDATGNFVTANQNVVINDNTNPTVPTIADFTAQCSVASLTAPTTTDNCSGTVTGTTTQTFPITAQGTTIVTWAFNDGNGNSVTANQNIVINDNTNPAVPTLADVTEQCSVPSIPAPTTTDNCSGTLTGTTTQTFPITSSTTVVWTFTDVAGNSVTANQNVIIDDTTDPVVPTLADVTEQCSVPSIPAPTTTDNCSGTLTGTTTQTFPINSSTTVVWTFTDGNGNSVTANQNVIIDDTTDPTIPTLPDVTAQCSVASIPAPTTTDNCSGTITGTTTQTFPITSSTTVVWTFTDVAGNSVTANQSVIIDDTTDPVIPTLADVTAQCSVASIPAPTTTDNCSGTLTGTTTQTFPITSSTTVVWTFTDVAGNSVTANQNVIIDDTTNPNVPTLADVTAQCSVPSIPAPTTTDNCSGTLTGTTSQTFPITTQGTTVVTWTFDDGNGNSVTANQNVIIDDTTDPNVPTLADVTAQCSVPSIPAPTTTDNCSGTLTGTTSQTFPITTQGTTVVTWTFDDGNGNSVTANQNVIIDDTTDPTITAPTNVTTNTDATLCTASNITLGTPTGNDNCGTVTFSNDAPSVFPIGTTTFTWTADDGNGNTATASQMVTVIDAKEINLLGNGVSILDGDATPDISDDTDFGNVATSRLVTYSLENTGPEDLLISSITSDNPSFSVFNIPTSVLAGTTATFDVQFSFGSLGLHTATITITNNDCDESLYDFAVQATQVTPPPPPVPVDAALGLTALATSTTQIDLNWTPNENATTYLLYRDNRLVSQFSAATSTYYDEELEADKFYQYELFAVIDNRNSAPSLAREWTFPEKPTLDSVATLCQEGNAFVALSSTGNKYRVYAEEQEGEMIFESNTSEFELPFVTSDAVFYVSTVGIRSLKESKRTEVRVNVEPIFEAKILGDSLQFSCVDSLILEAQEVENAVSYTWLLNGYEFGNGKTFTAKYSGNYQVRIQKGMCDFISEKVKVELNQTPIAKVQEQTGENEITFCQTGNLTASFAGQNATYQWTLNNIEVAQTRTIEVSQSGVYTLVVSNNGCQSSREASVIIVTKPQLPVLVATKDVLCQNEMTTLSIENPENGVTYKWTRNRTVLSFTGSSIEVNTIGAYSVEAISSLGNSCKTVSNIVRINHFEVIPVYLRLSQDKKTLFLEPATTQNQITNVEWYFDGEMKAELGTNIEISPTESGRYSALVTNQNGCVFQTRTSSFNLADDMITGEEDLKAGIFKIYPNPNNGTFNIHFGITLTKDIQVAIFDGIGRKITTQTFEKGKQDFKMNLNNQAKGMYLIHFNQNGATYSKQIIVE